MIRLGAVGDVVRTLPAASALRAAYPEAELAWLVESGSASLLRHQPWIDRVIEFPREALSASLRRVRPGALVGALRDFTRELRGFRFDLVVDFHGILKSGVLSRLSGAPCRVGYARPYAREGAHWFASQRARLSRDKMSRFDRNRALVDFLGVDAPGDPRPLHVDPEARARYRRALGGEQPIALHPGTSDATAHKRWTLDGYARLARALEAEHGFRSLVTCGPARDDRAFALALVDAARGSARLAPDTPGLPDLGALLSECRLYVGGDTGPLHVASLVGTPVVQLMGPTDPIENTPWGATASRRVRVQIGCNPCRRGCAAATCMGVIPPDEVERAAVSLLAAANGRC
ncbi:MAG: glycosyltransferase family 9 protein [Myxococcota bacterium]|nr:glycosyltransferase family 9 protein [Myxococcota bacterium]